MSQTDLPTIVPNTDTGTDLSNYLNAWKPTLYSTSSGTSRPTYAIAGTLWIDTSTPTNHILYLFDGTQDQEIGAWDPNTADSLIIGTNILEADFNAGAPPVKVGQLAFDISAPGAGGGAGGMTYFGYSNPGGQPQWIPIVDINQALSTAVVKDPTADQTITGADGFKPLHIDGQAETGNTPQLSITGAGGDVFSVDKSGALSAAGGDFEVDANGHVGVGDTAKNNQALHVTAAATDAYAMLVDASSMPDTVNNFGVRYNVNDAQTAIRVNNVDTISDQVFSVKGDGSGYFAGNLGVGVAADSKYGLDVATAPSGSTNAVALVKANGTGAKKAILLLSDKSGRGSDTALQVINSGTPSFEVKVNGDIKVQTASSQSIGLISDPRLKTSFTSHSYDLSTLDGVTVGHYDYLDGTLTNQLGIDAATLETAAPHCVHLTDEPVPAHRSTYYDTVDGEEVRNSTTLDPTHAIKAVDLGATVTLLLAALQDAKSINDAQQVQIDDLLTRVDALENPTWP